MTGPPPASVSGILPVMEEVSPGAGQARHRVLWDGDCVFCGRAARWCQRKDAAGRLELIPYQAAPSPPMTEALRAACADALHVIARDGRLLRAGRAMLFVFGELGHPRLARFLARRPMVWGVEIFYWTVARNRRLLSRLVFRGEGEARPGPGGAGEPGP